jgi:arsenite/tail-anchored protein-transporting ATPase
VQILLVTGPGGAGSSTVAAATADRLAAQGRRCVLVTTRTPRTAGLADAVTVDVVTPQPALERLWAAHAEALTGAVPLVTVPPASSVVPLPGVTEFALLAALAGHVRAADAEVLVVDAGALPTATGLLALPSALRWWLGQVAPTRLRVLATLRAAATPGRGTAAAGALAGVGGLEDLLDAVPLTDADVHLVLPAVPSAAEELETATTALAVLGRPVASVTVARLLPEGAGTWWEARAAVQDDAVARLRERAGTVRTVREAPVPPADLAALRALDAALDTAAPGGGAELPGPASRRADDGWVLEIPLPWAQRGGVELTRWADDLVVTAAGQRRSLPLDPLLRRCTVAGGSLRAPGTAAATLEVRFTPDPAQWPAGLLAAEGSRT